MKECSLTNPQFLLFESASIVRLLNSLPGVFFFIQFLKIAHNLHLLQNIDYLPHVVQ